MNEGWVVVLETFRQLDRILFTPHKIQEAAASSNELNILSSALDLLFKSSKTLENSALIFLMTALRKISTDAVQSPSQVSDFVD